MTDWTEARVEILREGVAGGLSYSQIAKRVGDGCTRCSAIGKASRMGLAQPATPSKPTVVRFTRPAKPVALKIAGRGTVFEEPEARPPRAVIPFTEEPAGCCDIMTIGAYQCKWPIGDPADADFTFCGKRAPDGPYCDAHRKRAYQPAQAKKRSSGAELARALRRYM